MTVKRLRGCLPDVTRREARVVVLRGGLGRAKPTSRARIARALGLSVSGVARAERSGLRRLRSRARSSNCESNEDASASAVRDAVAALAAGKGSDREGSGTATTADPERPAAATTSSDDRAHIWFLLALLGGALGVVLIARGVVKEARS